MITNKIQKIRNTILWLMLISPMIFFLSACGTDSASDGNASETKNENSGVQWVSFEEALEDKSDKEIFVMVHANWCPKCAQFKETTYLDPEVIQELNEYYKPVMFNAHSTDVIQYKGRSFANPSFDTSLGMDQMNSYHELLFEIGAKSIPSIVFFDKEGNVVGSEMGYKEADEFRAFMRLYSEAF